MEIFNNLERPNYEEILSYGPSWFAEYKEIDASLRFGGWTLDLMAVWLEKLINNYFPATADKQTIRIFEKALQIEPEPDDLIEERRRTVSAYWSGTGKLSGTVIKGIVKSYTGCDSELWWNGDTLQIRIFCDEGGQFSQKKIYNIVSRRMPAHIGFDFRDAICTFELSENIDFDKTIFRLPITWWDRTLDGSGTLCGDFALDAELPPYFRQKVTVTVENPVKMDFTASKYRAEIKNNFASEIKDRQRILLNWWEGRVALDGQVVLDGKRLLNQEVPPMFNKETYRTELETTEEFGFSVFTPALAKKLDGTVALDGAIKLNSGREEL